MEIDFNEQEKVSFRSFLIFSLFLLIILNTGFTLNSAYFRVSKVEVLGNNEIFDEADLIKPALGQSIWLVNSSSFSDPLLSLPSISLFFFPPSCPFNLLFLFPEYEPLMTITDLRGSVPKKSTLYKNMIEIESDETFLIPSLTITNGPVPTGFNGEMVSLIMTLKSYNLDVNSFNFTYDGDFFIGEYRSTLIDFGKPLDLGSKSSALGSLIENSDCQGEIRFISKEDIIANCS